METDNNQKKEVEIIPAILPADFYEIEEKMERIVGRVPVVQIDVVDGEFVKGVRTWPYKEIGDERFNALLLEQESFPFFNEISFEVDLMVSDPLSVWQDWVTLGAVRIIAHIEAVEERQDFLNRIKEMTVPHDSFFHIETGIAIGVETPISEIIDLIPHVDVVQCMGIAEIGKQGEEFDERVIEKIKEIKKQFPKCVVSVDGGVNSESAPLLRKAGADRLVSGSFIFDSDDVDEAINELRG